MNEFLGDSDEEFVVDSNSELPELQQSRLKTLDMEMRSFLNQIAPPLNGKRYKGQGGRIGVLGNHATKMQFYLSADGPK